MAEVGNGALPEDVEARIVMLLPTVDLLRGRAVCKRWLHLASHLLLSRPPWLLLSPQSSKKQAQYSLAYDPDAREWYQLPKITVPESHIVERCTEGLLIAQLQDVHSSRHTCYIGDPWTASWTQIQVVDFLTPLRGFQFNEGYTILASPEDDFDYVTKAFKQSPSSSTTQFLAYNLKGFTVERDGKLYGYVSPRGLRVYDKKGGTCVHLQGIMEEGTFGINRTNTLLNCGGKLVRVCDDYHYIHIRLKDRRRDVRVEQLCEESLLQEPLKWEEVGVMPIDLLNELLEGWLKLGIECFVVGTSHVCFRALKDIKIFSFDLVHRTWTWLPTYHPFVPSTFSLSQCLTLRGYNLKVWPRLFPNIVKMENDFVNNLWK